MAEPGHFPGPLQLSYPKYEQTTKWFFFFAKYWFIHSTHTCRPARCWPLFWRCSPSEGTIVSSLNSFSLISEPSFGTHLGLCVSREATGRVFPACLWRVLGSSLERWSGLACVPGCPFHGIIITQLDSDNYSAKLCTS